MFKKLLSVMVITLAFGLSTLSSSSIFAQSDPDIAIVNVNLASAEQIAEALDGVGTARAAAIVRHRENYGKFEHIEELLMVSGIGDNILEANRSKISVD
jgi:competence protein ComEA